MSKGAKSARFKTLRKRLGELRKTMLPSKFSPTGTYKPRELDRARGYRLLVHAEIEAYVEDVARDAILKKVSEWKKARAASEVVLAFLACYHSGFGAAADDETAIPSSARKEVKESAAETIDAAMKQYMHRLGENHGVKIDNLRRLLLPAGVRFDELDATWLTSIDDFGKRRGEVAHQSITAAQHQIDPQSEYQNVQLLLAGLEDLDLQLSELSA